MVLRNGLKNNLKQEKVTNHEMKIKFLIKTRVILLKVAGKIDLDDVLFAVSLDSLGRVNLPEDANLYAHVSRPPKEGQASFEFLRV